MPDQPRSSRSVSTESIYSLHARGASPDLIRAAQKTRRRKAKIKLRPTWRYSVRWDELDFVSGESGHGLLNGLRIWWSVRRGTWLDDWIASDFDTVDDS